MRVPLASNLHKGLERAELNQDWHGKTDTSATMPILGCSWYRENVPSDYALLNWVVRAELRASVEAPSMNRAARQNSTSNEEGGGGNALSASMSIP